MANKQGGGSRQTGDKISTLASGVLSGKIQPTAAQIRSLAASALAQDEHRGKRGK